MGRHDLSRTACAAALGAVGIAHFLSPRVFVDHIPPDVPGRLALVYATGALELAIAAALVLAPPAQRGAAIQHPDLAELCACRNGGGLSVRRD